MTKGNKRLWPFGSCVGVRADFLEAKLTPDRDLSMMFTEYPLVLRCSRFRAYPIWRWECISATWNQEWKILSAHKLELDVFPFKLVLNRGEKKEAPAVPFNENPVSRLNEEIKIFVTPSQYFNAKFRGIFTRTKIQHSSGAESKRWLAGAIYELPASTAQLRSMVRTDRLWNISWSAW